MTGSRRHNLDLNVIHVAALNTHQKLVPFESSTGKLEYSRQRLNTAADQRDRIH
jgi:hypothetical protein